MKSAQVLALVREAMKYARLETAEFGSIHRDTAIGRSNPVRNDAGEIVTEANVTEFIRERVASHHDSWIIGSLEQATELIQRDVKHRFMPVTRIPYLCIHCRENESHRSHTK